MGRHTESDDVVFLAVELEIGGVVTFVPIEDEKTITTGSSRLSVPVKVLNPFQTSLVCGPAVGRCGDNPVAWESAVLVPGGEMIFARNDDVWRDRPALRVDTLNNCHPFPIAWLNSFTSAI